MEHYHAYGYKERERLIMKFCGLKMEIGKHFRKYLLRFNRLLREVERVGRPIDEKDVDLVSTSGLSSQYDAEAGMPGSSANWPDRDWMERTIPNQYERPDGKKTVAGSHALVTTNSDSDRYAFLPPLLQTRAQRNILPQISRHCAQPRRRTKFRPPDRQH